MEDILLNAERIMKLLPFRFLYLRLYIALLFVFIISACNTLQSHVSPTTPMTSFAAASLSESKIVSAEKGYFIAYSLHEAERQLKKSVYSDTKLMEVGGITKIVGVVHDSLRGDLIVIGQVNERGQKISLEDFVVAMRALFIHKEWPLVSLNKTPETHKTEKLVVQFKGGIGNTKFGKKLFETDVMLKKLALGLLSTDIWGGKSYFDMLKEYAQEKGMEIKTNASFWFYPKSPTLAVREDVVVIKDLNVGVRNAVIRANVNGEYMNDFSKIRNEMGDKFAAAISDNYDNLSRYYPEIGKLKTLLQLVALAKGVQYLSSKPDIIFWLYDYEVQKIETSTTYPLIIRREKIKEGDRPIVIEVDGGLELKALILRLKEGDLTALRDIVIKSRPNKNTLTWRVPLEGWHV